MTQQLTDQRQSALRTFRRDLAQLWNERPGQWVAYQGDHQIGFAGKKHELYQQCFQRGLQADEFAIFCIEAAETELTLGLVVLDE